MAASRGPGFQFKFLLLSIHPTWNVDSSHYLKLQKVTSRANCHTQVSIHKSIRIRISVNLCMYTCARPGGCFKATWQNGKAASILDCDLSLQKYFSSCTFWERQWLPLHFKKLHFLTAETKVKGWTSWSRENLNQAPTSISKGF